jgi:hypothetical protein
MTKSRFALATIAALTFFGSSIASAAPALLNGGFETVNGPMGFTYAGSNTIGSWSTSGSNAFGAVANTTTANTTGIMLGTDPVYLWGPITASANGGNFILSDADKASAMTFSQTVTGLTVGAIYTLSFEYAAAQYRLADGTGYNGDSGSGWNVSFGTDMYSTGAVLIGSHQFSGWKTATTTFKASSTSQLLSFMASAPMGAPPAALLDGVSLTENANVPLPGTLLLVGLAGLMGVVSRKKKAA